MTLILAIVLLALHASQVKKNSCSTSLEIAAQTMLIRYFISDWFSPGYALGIAIIAACAIVEFVNVYSQVSIHENFVVDSEAK
jgi:hypothetical protein